MTSIISAALDIPFAITIRLCMRIVPHLQRGESIALHCPTLTRRALIILTLFCKAKPSLPSDCSPMHRDDRRFSVRQTCFIYAEKYTAMRRIDIFSLLRSTSLIPFRPRKSHHLSASSIYLSP